MPVNEDLLKTVDWFNDFTTLLFINIKSNEQGFIPVEMRNGLVVKVTWKEGNPKYDEQGSFSSVDNSYRWYNNGSSLTSKDFDLIRY